MQVNVRVEGINKLVRLIPEARDTADRESKAAMYESVAIVEEQVVGLTPVGATGNLRQSITTEVRGAAFQKMRGYVFTPIAYGLPVEEGRAPGRFPPIDPIELWVIRKRIAPANEARRVAFLIARSIARHGTKGAFMFERGLDKATPKVISIWDDLPVRIVEAMAR